MLIKDLKEDYPLVYEEILINIHNARKRKGLMDISDTQIHNQHLEAAFIYNPSPEREDFWRYIMNEKFDKAKELCPHLFIKNAKFKVGDNIKSIDGGFQYTENGLENRDALSCCSSTDTSKKGKCTKVTYSNKNQIWFYKIDDYTNMFTENCIVLVSTDLKDYVGRYLLALVDRPHGGSVKKGDYGLILNTRKVAFSSQKDYSCPMALKFPDRYQLMPEGFKPDVKLEKKTVIDTDEPVIKPTLIFSGEDSWGTTAHITKLKLEDYIHSDKFMEPIKISKVKKSKNKLKIIL